MKLTFKKATQKDAAKLVEMDKIIFTRPFDIFFTEPEFKKIFNHKGETGFIYNGKKLTGYYSWIDIDKNVTELMSIGILPEFQGKGIGSECVKYILSNLKKKKRIILVTHPKNIGALKTYMKHGFEIYGFKENHYGPGHHRVMMQKSN